MLFSSRKNCGHYLDFLSSDKESVIADSEAVELGSLHPVSTEFVRHQTHVDSFTIRGLGVVHQVPVVEVVAAQLVAQQDVAGPESPSGPAVTDAITNDML